MHILGPGFILGRFFLLLFRIKLQVKLQLALKGNALNLKIYKPSGRGEGLLQKQRIKLENILI